MRIFTFRHYEIDWQKDLFFRWNRILFSKIMLLSCYWYFAVHIRLVNDHICTPFTHQFWKLNFISKWNVGLRRLFLCIRFSFGFNLTKKHVLSQHRNNLRECRKESVLKTSYNLAFERPCTKHQTNSLIYEIHRNFYVFLSSSSSSCCMMNMSH